MGPRRNRHVQGPLSKLQCFRKNTPPSNNDSVSTLHRLSILEGHECFINTANGPLPMPTPQWCWEKCRDTLQEINLNDSKFADEIIPAKVCNHKYLTHMEQQRAGDEMISVLYICTICEHIRYTAPPPENLVDEDKSGCMQPT